MHRNPGMYWFPSMSGSTILSPPVPKRLFCFVHRAPSTKFSATTNPCSIAFPHDGHGLSAIEPSEWPAG